MRGAGSDARNSRLQGLPPRQFLTKVERARPVRFLASACLLQAFSDVCLIGVAFALLGVAVVGGGVSVPKATPQPRRATATETVILIQVSSSNGDPAARRSGDTR